MKHLLRNISYFPGLLTILLLLSITGCKQAPGEQTELWNGNNFEGWIKYAAIDTVSLDTVWTVNNGVIRCTGDPYGYIRTEETFSDYQLHVEWRWPKEAGNSGVFLHVQEKDTLWPMCIEAQLKAENAGDFIAMNGARFNEQIEDSRKLVKKNESSELEPGEWNVYEITCSEDTVKVEVNGVHQNTITGVSISSGHIGLQSEGAPIEFRNVYLKEL